MEVAGMTALAELLTAVKQRATSDPQSVVPVLEMLADPLLADADSEGERAMRHAMAVAVNRRRLVEAEQRLRAGAWDTATVRERLGISRQAVNDRLRHGSLLGVKIGHRFAYPDWQFDRTGTVSGLAEVLAVLRPIVNDDVRAADGVMRAAQPDLPDRMSLAELLAAGGADEVAHRLAARAEQS